MRGFSPLDVMTLRDVRAGAEAGAGIAALDVGLGEILWANGAGRTLLGLSMAGGSLPATSAQGRQIKAAARLLDTRGEARVLLRPATGLASKPVVADLKRVAVAQNSFVLLTASAMRPAGTSDLELAERLLAESGIEDAAIYGEQGRLTPADGFPADAEVPLDAVAALIASDEEMRVVEGEGYRVTLSRVASGLVLVRHESIAPPAAAAAVEEPQDAEPPSRTAGFFSVKRRKLAAGRGAMSMSALVQRWHRRQDDAEQPQTEAAREAGPAAAIGDDAVLGEGEERPADEGAIASTGRAEQVALIAGDEEREDADAFDDAGVCGGKPATVETEAKSDLHEKRQGISDTSDAAAANDGLTLHEDRETPPDMAASTALMRSLWSSHTPASAPAAEDEPGREAVTSAEPAEAPPASPEPISPRPGPVEGPIAVPSDTPAGTEGEAGQPVEKESVVILPDVRPEEAPGLDVPISDDTEVPGGEAMIPAKEEAPATNLADEEPFAVDPAEVLPNDNAPSDPERSAPDRSEAVDIAPAPAEPVLTLTSGVTKPRFEPRFDIAPVRFVWQIDRDGKFRSLSSEFAGAVGPKAAAVLGLSFREIANVFGFDTGGEITRLLDRRDTWSGRSILWPVEASDRKVPVDLAALPVYARDRSFDGFRGFGIVKMNEAVADAEAIGLVLAGDGDRAIEEAARMPALEAPEALTTAAVEKPLFRTFEAGLPGVAFGRRQEPPQFSDEFAADREDAGPAAIGSNDDDGEPKVIRLEERRRPRDGVLSQAEEAAFRAIGMKLGQQSEAEAPDAPRFVDRPAEIGADAGPGDREQARETAEGRERLPIAGEQDQSRHAGETDAEDATAHDDPQSAESVLDDGARVPTDAEIEASSGKLDRPTDAEGTPGDLANDENPCAKGPQPESASPDGPASVGLEADEAGAKPSRATDMTADEHHAAVADDGAEAGRDEREDDEPAERPLDAAAMARELEAIFASLPLPVLVQVRETLVYANREFEDFSGYAGIAALEAAGGLDALFVEREDGLKAGELAIRRSNGQVSDVRVHMQRVTFSGRSSLLMSFSPSPRDSAAAVHPVAEEAPVEQPASAELEDLRQEVEELQAVLDTATDGVVLLDPAGTIRAMNGSAHALFGGGLSDHAGRHLSSLFAHESQKATHDYLDMLRDDGLAGILNDGREVIGRVAQGGFIPLFITIGRLSGERGWCVVIRDIAHWKRIEEDLVNARRQAEAASLHKSRFLANISHELRTPLNAIIGFADVMASECFGPIGNERYLEYLGDIKRSGHHVLDLVNDLLDISKIEAGKLDLAFEAVLLNEVVSEVVALMQPQANRERVIVRSNLPSSVPPVVADRRTMRQIALNLVANAIRFTPAGGQIIASTTYTVEGDVLLRFRDSGIGMTEREIEIALTPFQQVHAPSVVRGEGTGLGLPLTKAMVEANRAAFAINSVPGEGTLVEITFPSQRVLAD